MAQGVVDVHSHLITPEFVSVLENEGRLMDEGFPLPKYDVREHLRWMDEAGVQTSVLTLAAPQPSSSEIVRQTNEAAARIKREHPGRFLFCVTLPLPDVSKAICEAIYALDTLKADGIKLATNVRNSESHQACLNGRVATDEDEVNVRNSESHQACLNGRVATDEDEVNVDGQYLGAPELDTLFSVLNERRAVIILHPHRPETVNRQVMQQTPLAMQEYLSETTRAVTNMISRNVLARYPNVKVVVPHCGAYLPLAIPRMKSLTPVMQANKMVGEIDYEANLAALYYDLAGARSPEVIRMLLTITTPDHLLYGSDYPYVAPQVLTQSLARMKQYLSDEADLAPFREMILHKNAQWLYGQTAEKPSAVSRTTDSMLFRLAEIEVDPQYLKEYLVAAAEIQKASLAEEPGVVCLFPTQTKEDSTQIRILEIYASQQAYQHHIQTAHFQKYKQGTLHMVKSLKLQDLTPLAPEAMTKIFKRLQQ